MTNLTYLSKKNDWNSKPLDYATLTQLLIQYYHTVVVCTDPSGKETHRQVSGNKAIASGSIASIMARMSPGIATNVGSNHVLGEYFAFSSTPLPLSVTWIVYTVWLLDLSCVYKCIDSMYHYVTVTYGGKPFKRLILLVGRVEQVYQCAMTSQARSQTGRVIASGSLDSIMVRMLAPE